MSHYFLLETELLQALLRRAGVDRNVGGAPEEVVETPSLAGMRHSAWILSSLLRVPSQNVPITSYQSILEVCALFLQSPDTEVLIDVCSTINSIIEVYLGANRNILESGMVSRLVQLASSVALIGVQRPLGPKVVSAALRRASVRTLAVIVRRGSPFEISVVLRTRGSVFAIFCSEIQNEESDHEV
jgi:hypothetical protein